MRVYRQVSTLGMDDNGLQCTWAARTLVPSTRTLECGKRPRTLGVCVDRHLRAAGQKRVLSLQPGAIASAAWCGLSIIS